MTEPAATSAPASAATDAGRADPWTTRRLLDWIAGFLGERGVGSPRLVGEMLLAHVFECERMRLYMEVERPASPEELSRLRTLVARAGRHEPIHYLVGSASFYWRSFAVGTSTLIPQPCTETLVDHVLAHFGGRRSEAASLPSGPPQAEPPEPDQCRAGPLLADVGTGSGCIAVTLAAQIPGALVVATDIVPEALELARRNAARFGVEPRIELRLGSLAAPLAEHVERTGRRFDAICANLPYIPRDEIGSMDAAVRDHVPRSAWYGGADGLELLAPFIDALPPLLVPDGLVALEIAHVQRDRVLHRAEAAGLERAAVLEDQDGLWRVLVARAPGPRDVITPPTP